MPENDGGMALRTASTVRRNVIAVAVVSCLCLAPGALAPSAASAAACSTNDPAANFAGPKLDFGNVNSDKVIEENFTKARAAEGCNTPLTLPPGFDGLSPQVQMLTIFNLEREARGLADLTLDSTLMSQVALNHSQEMATYGYFAHPSPINQGENVSKRQTVNPILAQPFPSLCCAENISAGQATAASAVFGFMYEDAASGWGHRHNILQKEDNWVGIGIVLNAAGSVWTNYWTDDFAKLANYKPPATADTNPPVMGQATSNNGVATVTGVADNPANVNDTGANPATAGITSVVFYTNKIVETNKMFNTVLATQTAPGSGTWTANVTVNPGEVLHAVAVDGSGNFTDLAPAPPAMPLEPGPNPVALPAPGEPPAPAEPGVPAEPPLEEFPIPPEFLEVAAPATAASAHHGVRATSAKSTSTGRLAVTPTAEDLIDSVDDQFGHRPVAKDVRVYLNGEWKIFNPVQSHPEKTHPWKSHPVKFHHGKSHAKKADAEKSNDFLLYTGEGVIVDMTVKGMWRPSAGRQRPVAPTVSLHGGWNFVTAPYPVSGLTCDMVQDGLARSGVRLEQLTLGATATVGEAECTSAKDADEVLPSEFWLKSSGPATWVPRTFVSNRTSAVIIK